MQNHTTQTRVSYYQGSTACRTIPHKQECRIIKVPLHAEPYHTNKSVILSRFHCIQKHTTQTRVSYYQGSTACRTIPHKQECHIIKVPLHTEAYHTNKSVVLSRSHCIQKHLTRKQECRIIKDQLHQCLTFKFLPLLVSTCMVCGCACHSLLVLLSCSVLVLLGVTSGWRLLNQTQVNACMPM